MIALAENVQWGSSPRIYVSFYYEKIRDGANMKYRTKTVIKPLTGESYFGFSIEQVLTIDGDEKEYEMLKDSSPSQWGDSIEYVSPWYTVSNKTSGTTSVTFNLFSNSGRDDYFDYSMAVDPAYTSITSFSVAKRSETSVTYSFTTADVCDYAYYSTDDGASWAGVDITDGKSASFVVNKLSSNTSVSLSPNTTYNFKVKVRRKDSGMETISNRVQQTTYKAPTQSLNDRTETTITMNWSIDSTADRIWYSTNNGSSWSNEIEVNATSGSYTITTGLSPNTSYNIKTRVRRKASQTTYDTSALSVTTYDYPYVSKVGSNPLTIGNSQTLTLSNPLSRSVTVKMYQNNTSGTQLYSGTTNGTSITFTPDANTLYASIPNSPNGNCVYSVIYGSSTKTTSTCKYQITGNEKPTFSNFTYADTNANTTALTGNNQILVNGYSNVTTTISVANKATPKNSTTMKDYTLSIGNKSAQVNYSDNSDVTMSVTAVNSGTIKVTANDNRGLGTVVEKNATFKNYSKPAVTSLTATRGNNGVGESVTLSFTGTWWNDNFGSVANSITNIQYYFRKSTTQTWTTGSTTITATTSNNNFSGSVAVAGDTQSSGFDAASSYYIKIVVTDQLDHSEEFQTTIGSGTPAISIYKDNVAIGKQYDTTLGGKFQLNGTGYNYNNGAIPGVKEGNATTIPNFITELRYTNGQMGSVTINTAYTLNNITLPTGWYNYIYMPHRSGGISGSASGDNCNYGNLVLYGMTNNTAMYEIRLANGSIASLQMFTRKNDIVDIIYPVGSVYLSINATSPATLFGGTWVQIKDGFLFCTTATSGTAGAQGNTESGNARTQASSGSTGSTTLTVDQIPSHQHTQYLDYSDNSYPQAVAGGTQGQGNNATHSSGTIKTTQTATVKTANTGGGQGHTHSLNNHKHNIPYTTVFVWKRTA